MTNFMRVSRAAKELGVSRTRLYKLIDQGRIPSVKIDDYVFIDMDNQEKWDWVKTEEKTKTE